MLLLYHVIVLSLRELEPFKNHTLFVVIVLRHSLLLRYDIVSSYQKDLKCLNQRTVNVGYESAAIQALC